MSDSLCHAFFNFPFPYIAFAEGFLKYCMSLVVCLMILIKNSLDCFGKILLRRVIGNRACL